MRTFTKVQSAHIDPPVDDDTLTLSAAEYFSSDTAASLILTGRPKHVVRKSNTFTEQLWLCDEEDFPLDLMMRAPTRAHVAQRRNNSHRSLTNWRRQVHTLHDCNASSSYNCLPATRRKSIYHSCTDHIRECWVQRACGERRDWSVAARAHTRLCAVQLNPVTDKRTCMIDECFRCATSVCPCRSVSTKCARRSASGRCAACTLTTCANYQYRVGCASRQRHRRIPATIGDRTQSRSGVY